MSWEEVAAAQDGLISRSQLLGTGLTVEAVRWLVTDGRLIRSCRGVYRVIGSPTSPWTPLRAALHADRERDLLATRVGWRLLHVTSRTPIREVTATLLPLLGQKVG